MIFGKWRSALLAAGLATLAAQQAAAQAVPTPDARQYGLGMIGAPAAWALGYTGNGITVAVADSGIDTTHPAFAGKIDNRSRSFVLTAPGVAYDPTAIDDKDPKSHGTHVAGIIGSSAASAVPGDAYNAGLVVLRIFSNCAKGVNCDVPSLEDSAGVSALDYFRGLNNVLIYNASYGPTSGKNQTSWATTTIDTREAAVALATLTAGKIIVAANGNDRAENPIAGVNPNGMALYPFIRPANANAGVYQDGGRGFDFANLLQQPGLIIAVTAVGANKLISGYAQTCGVTASWCVAAPGGDDTDDGIYATLPVSTFGFMQGTSMATPMTSGALAVLQQAYPTYAARDLAGVLFATAENIGGRPAVNATYGYGLIRLDRGVAGPTTLAAGADVAVAAQQTTYWSQPLTTAGGFTKSGTGTLIIAGRTTAAGDVAVNAGAFGVDGTLTLQSQMTIAQGTMLAGFGRIVGNTTINGALNAGQLPNYADLMANNGGALPAGTPLTGTSPGTLTFQGNVTLTGAATTRANIDGVLQIPGGPGTYDKIFVTGAGATFTANGVLLPVLRGIASGNNTYSPAIGTKFDFVIAQNGAAIAGQFTALTQPTAGLAANTRLDVVYSATTIAFNVTPLDLSNLVAADGQNRNVQNVANAIDAARPAPGVAPRGAAKAVFDDLYDNTAAEDDAEFTSLSGEGQADNAGVTLNAFSGFSDVIAGRQAMTTLAYAGLVEGGEAAPRPAMFVPSDGWSAWGQGFGRWTKIGDDAGLPGSHTGSHGIALGADRVFEENLRAGTAFGYVHSVTNSFVETASADSYAVAAYATWTPDGYVIDGRLAVGPTSGNTSRLVVVLGTTHIVDGSTNGWGGALAVQAGYPVALGDLAVMPFAGLVAQVSSRDAFTETSPVGLSFPSQTFSRVTLKLGAQASTTFTLAGLDVTPRTSFAWSHSAGDNGLVTHAAIFDQPFVIDAADPGRDAALVDAKLHIQASDNLDVFVGYSGEFRRNATSHEVSGGLRLKL